MAATAATAATPIDEEVDDITPLLGPRAAASSAPIRKLHHLEGSPAHSASSIISSHVSKDEQTLGALAIGERLPYNDYTTIDWLHDLIKDSFRHRALQTNRSLRGRIALAWDGSQGWLAAALIGFLTAVVAFLVDVAEATNRDGCCRTVLHLAEDCVDWTSWSKVYARSYSIYVAFALLFGFTAGSVTMLTKAHLPSVPHSDECHAGLGEDQTSRGKVIYMAAGSGIPEIKTILSGFVIPHFLDLKVLLVKAVGATFAVATGMCLGKEGPFVHISTCVGYLIVMLFPKYRDNGRKMREMLSVACSAGLSVAFGAPIGGVLFSYEASQPRLMRSRQLTFNKEISTHFPRKVLWRSFLCSLIAAVVLKALNPNGTGKLILFETKYGIDYDPIHYLVFIGLGICGGLFGGIFCKANFFWSKKFRKHSLIANHPVFELVLVVLVTALLQYPNPLTRQPGDVIIKNLLIECGRTEQSVSWVCRQESGNDKSWYYGWLAYGTMVKLLLTIITFGCKVPSGIIIPALDAGALFGRLVGQLIPDISPGIFAMVSAAAFLAGVSRMTVSLAVIMFELTGEVDYIPPFMVAILVAKWVADALSREGVYDLAQAVLGHPFLDSEHALNIVTDAGVLVHELIPPAQTMHEITVDVGPDFKVSKNVLATKLGQLNDRGLMDAGLVLVTEQRQLYGYLAQGELAFAVNHGKVLDGEVDLLDGPLSGFIDRTPLTICDMAPMEYAVEMFGKLGLRHLIVVGEGGQVLGVIIKKRLVLYLEGLQSR